MTDWDLLTPGIGLTSIGICGVGLSLAGIAKTFVEGMHAVSLLTMFIGMIFLASGLFKDGFPSTGRAKSATFITLGFLVTFGVAAAVTVSAQVPSIFAYIGLMMIISIPAAVLTVASYRRTPYIKALAVIFIGGAIVGGASFYVFGLVTPKPPAPPQTSGGGGNATTGQAAAPPPNLSQIIKVTILPGASAKGNPNFDPKDLSVPKKAGIRWTNNDNVPHTVTSYKDSGKSFDSSLIMPKKTFTLDTSKLTQNEYDYFCTIHPFMRAKFTIGVTASAGKNSATSTGAAASSTAGTGGAAIQSAKPAAAAPAGATSITILAGASTQGNPNFDPAAGKVPLGSKVVWQNKDNTIHTATS
ncbi:MAG: cupredoxin domain-containing protein, partial [Nitrososphaeraceae archaeon]|nr:cupredoxin domain-containing protein [Nitrososphaeraceae archaeon]